MIKASVDFDKVLGRIKPMHAVGQPPFLGMNFRWFSYLKDAAIPYARLHDVGGAYGRGVFVDIPNLFRDFDKDPADPASYDFAFTDRLLEALAEYGIQPIFRLGVTIENYHKVKAYFIHPPKDPAKWARICEGVVRHYNEGWAEGYRMGIRYWEIWNEPDNDVEGADNQMWTGSPQEYYTLYSTAAKHLKACFGDAILVGGYAGSGFYGIFAHPEEYGVPGPARGGFFQSQRVQHRTEFFHRFLEHIRKENAPLDFFSWHSYAGIEDTVVMSEFVSRTLAEYGYGGVEIHLNEWNNSPNRDRDTVEKCGTSEDAALAGGMLCAMQRTRTDMLCYYDARIGASVYGGMFSPATFTPYCLYHVFAAFGRLYRMGTWVESASGDPQVYMLSAKGEGKRGILLCNTSPEEKRMLGLPGGMQVYRINKEEAFSPGAAASEDLVLPPFTVAYLEALEQEMQL